MPRQPVDDAADASSSSSGHPEEAKAPDTPIQWAAESRNLVYSSAPLVLTFLLQYSVDVSSVIAAGRLGTIELGAVSRESHPVHYTISCIVRVTDHIPVANITAAISCFTIFQGLATSLDTLCAQAYGYGHRHLVGVYCQRMVLFLLCLSAPIVVLWIFSEQIVVHIVPEPETARLASLYLKVLIAAIPGYIVFESGKRFLQAQGLFHGTTYVLVIASPIHGFLMWFLVNRLGFIGAPIAVVCTRTLLPVLLVLYVVFIDGSECWGGFSKSALKNWRTMITIAIPDMIMVEAEWLAFEVIVIMAGQFGTEYLAAQSLLSTISAVAFQVPFPLSIAVSTRIGSLIGGGQVAMAKNAALVVS